MTALRSDSNSSSEIQTWHFEPQTGRDCTIHSFNNAFGGPVLEKEAVLAKIEEVVGAQLDRLRTNTAISEAELARRETVMRDRYSDGDSFFAADIVWAAGKDHYHEAIRLDGVEAPFGHIELLLLPEIRARPVIVLGKVKHNHAIACRDGHILDSEFAALGPRPIDAKALAKSLREVRGAYVFTASPANSAQIRRAIRATPTKRQE